MSNATKLSPSPGRSSYSRNCQQWFRSMGTHSNSRTRFDPTGLSYAEFRWPRSVERINARTTVARPKVIMLTAFGQESLTHQAMVLGVDYFILKPFDLDILGKRI